MRPKIIKKWENEEGIECELREDGKVWRTLFKGRWVENKKTCGIDIIEDEKYNSRARFYLRKRRILKTYMS